MSEDRRTERPVCADDSAPSVRSYANGVATDITLSEIELRFGQRFGPGGRLTVHTWLVTSPVHLVSFSNTLAATIAAYEDRYGVIPTPVASAADDQES